MAQIDAKLFSGTKPKSAVDITIETIQKLLITKQLSPGDKLPTELELSESLQISRGSVREAMKVLSSYGIVKIRRGDGTYVSQEMTDGLFDHLLFQMILTDLDKQKLLELRELMEIGMVKMVVEHAEEKDLKKIRSAHEEMSAAVESGSCDISTLAKYDLKFHTTIAEATKNPLVEKIYGFTMELFQPSMERSVSRGYNGKYSVEFHEQIVKGLENRSIDQTVFAVKQSILKWFVLME